MLKQALGRTVVLTFISVLLLLLAGCGAFSGSGDDQSQRSSSPDPTGDYAGLVVTQKRAPDFDQLQDGVLIATARAPEDYPAIWSLYRLEGSPPPVDFDHKVVFFFAMGESGSCPLALRDVTVDAGQGLVTAHVSTDVGDDVACTEDWTPRTFVVALARDEIPSGRLQGRITGDHVERVQDIYER